MKKNNTNRYNKKITRMALAFVLLIFFVSLFLLIASVLPKKDPSMQDIGYAFNGNSDSLRKFKIESKTEGIYNLGEYTVNLNRKKHLTLDISVKCKDNSFHTLVQNNIVIQNAILDTFATFGSMQLPKTPHGKDLIKQHIKEKICKIVHEPIIDEVYFNKFLID